MTLTTTGLKALAWRKFFSTPESLGHRVILKRYKSWQRKNKPVRLIAKLMGRTSIGVQAKALQEHIDQAPVSRSTEAPYS